MRDDCMGIGEARPNIVWFELRMVVDDRLGRLTLSKKTQDRLDGDAHPSDDRLSAEDVRIVSDTCKQPLVRHRSLPCEQGCSHGNGAFEGRSRGVYLAPKRHGWRRRSPRPAPGSSRWYQPPAASAAFDGPWLAEDDEQVGGSSRRRRPQVSARRGSATPSGTSGWRRWSCSTRSMARSTRHDRRASGSSLRATGAWRRRLQLRRRVPGHPPPPEPQLDGVERLGPDGLLAGVRADNDPPARLEAIYRSE